MSASELGDTATIVFASIGCTNAAGLRSFHYTEFTLDASAPIAGEVLEVCDKTLDVVSPGGVNCIHFDAHKLSARWTPWEDLESGITHYSVSFGLAPDDDSIWATTEVGLTTEVLFDLL
eukprot:COSAG06_NODE_35909_length_454_cov_0.723944_2_plen_118_part_01